MSVRDQYERTYASFGGLPGYAREAAYVTAIFDLLTARGLIGPPDHRTLADLGSGVGLKTHALAARFERTIGFDFSARAVELATLLNDDPRLSFRQLDVLHEDPGERFEVVTAFGLSVLNDPRPEHVATRVGQLVDRFVTGDGVFVAVGQTDQSGSGRDGWFNHTRPQIRELAAHVAERFGSAVVCWPHRDRRAYFSFGAEHALRTLATVVLRRRRDYCLVVRKAAER